MPRSNTRLLRRFAACMAALALFSVPAKAATIFKEAGGVLVMEAEHFDSRTTTADGHKFLIAPDEVTLGQSGGTPVYQNARGSYITPQPDTAGGGVNNNGADGQNVGPFVDYKFVISTPGDYSIYLRWGGYDGSSDSMYAQILELNTQTPMWYRFARSVSADFASAAWDNNGAVEVNNGGGGEVPAVWTFAAGTYTLRLSMREDGSGTDAIALQLSSLAAPTDAVAESDLQEGFILNPPANATALPPNPATFTAGAKTGGGATVTYQWQSKAPGATTFTDIAGATSISYTTPPTTLAMNGTQYRVTATSGGTTLTSAAATLTTDNVPPALVHAFSGPANTSLTLNFTEKLDSASATTIGNYTLSGGLTVSAATLSPDGKSVYLKTSAQTPSTAYTVTVNGVKDVPGNALNGGTASFKGPVDITGKLLVRKYEGIGGVTINNLTTSPKYPDQPTSVTYWTAFGGDSIFPTTGDNLGDNYGLEITGFVLPTVTADYEFYIASDDASQLWLSTDETAANATLIAQQPGCCNTFTHAPGGLSSNPIHLEAGKRYYVRAYLKEGGGGDFLSVAWRNSVTDGDITVAPTGNLEGIPGDNLATGYDPSASVTITTQPASLTTKENAPFSFTVAYNAYSPLLGTVATVQWQKAAAGSSTFTDITGATGLSYGGTFAKASDNGAQYRAVVTSGDVVVTSDPATLTVSGSVPIVTLPKTIEHRYWNNINGNVGTLKSDPRYPNNPTFITFEPLFEYPPNGGNGAGDTYGNRLAGWLVPPEDGDYVFFTCSDDPSELWLSTDQDPANKKLIALETGWSNARQWVSSGGNSDLTAKRSDQFVNTQWPTKDTVNGGALITLQKGQHYYIEVLHTEGGGGDDVGVTWRLPSAAGVDPADGDPPIAADFVDQLYSITGTINFTTQPASQSVAANSAATFTVAATSSDNSPITYIWEMAPKGSTDFVAVGNGTSYTTPLLNQTTDDQSQYRVLATSPTGAGLSSVATLTVTVDTQPPTVTYFAGERTAALIVFSEPVDATTAGDAANYTLSPSGTVTSATVGTTPAGFGMVTLALSGLTDLQTYTLTIKNVKDTASNPMAQVTETFKAYDIYADFNGPVPPPKATLIGSANIKTSGSFDGSGFLELTRNAGSLQGTIGIDDMLAGETLDAANKLTAQFKLFVGNGSGNAADGFSFNVASDIDPTTVSTGEDGTGSGLSVDFDTYDNGGGEAPSIEVRWGGAVFATTVGSTTPVTKATLVNNQWVDVFIQMTGDPTAGTGKITVVHNNVKYFDNVDIPGWTPIATPKVAFGARTGGEFETHNIDNFSVVYNVDVAPPNPPTISITSPVSGDTITAGTATTITVNAAADAGVNKVEFFANNNLLGQSTTAPYSFTVPGAAVTPGFYTLTAKITDNSGIAVTSAGVNVTVRPPASANAKKILFVRASAGPNTSNMAEMNHLFALGYDVYDVAADASLATDADGKAAVVISSTVSSGQVNTKFQTVTTPVMEWENALEDDFLLTLNGAADHGGLAGQTSIDILPGVTSKLAAGLSGNVVVTTAADSFTWGLPTASAKKIASIAGDTTKTAIYAVEAGDTLIDGSAAAGRRVVFFLGDSTFLLLNADGMKLFDAAVDYTVNGDNTPPPTPTITVSQNGANLNISWTPTAAGNVLESTPALGPTQQWTTVSTTSPATVPIGTGNLFFRVRAP